MNTHFRIEGTDKYVLGVSVDVSLSFGHTPYDYLQKTAICLSPREWVIEELPFSTRFIKIPLFGGKSFTAETEVFRSYGRKPGKKHFELYVSPRLEKRAVKVSKAECVGDVITVIMIVSDDVAEKYFKPDDFHFFPVYQPKEQIEAVINIATQSIIFNKTEIEPR